MNLENVHYNAFISYRHCEKDKFVAENLHRILEAFSLPAGIRKDHPELPKKIERVFRDQEELPLAANLADPITEALRNSDNLIVICTPRLKESLWCQKEIETFIEMHGRSHVFAVLAEGEPEDSFPYQLLVDDAGYPIEPLGADVRGETHQQILKKMKTEALRLIAPMFELNYDDLRQRHKEQRTRRLFAIGAAAMAVVLAFGIYSSVMALKIKRQADDIAAQNVKITKQSEEIESQNEEIKKQAHDIAMKYALSVAADSVEVMSSCDRPAAVRMLRDVLPDDKNDELVPYTQECESTLTDVLGMYEIGNRLYPYDYYDSDEAITSFGTTEDGDYLYWMNDSGLLKIYETDTHTELFSKQAVKYPDRYSAVVSGHKVYYRNSDYCLSVIDIDKGTDNEVFGEVYSIYKVKNHDYIVTEHSDGINLIDTSSDDVVIEIGYESTYAESNHGETMNEIAMSDDEKYLFTAFVTYYDGLNKIGRLAVYDLETLQLFREITLDDNCSVKSMCQNGNILYYSFLKSTDAVSGISTLCGYDYINNSFVFQNRISNHELLDMDFIDKGNEAYIYARDESGAYTFDAKDGTILYNEPCRERVIAGMRISDDGHQMLFMDNGQFMLYMVENGFLLGNEYFKYPFYEEVNDVQFVKGQFALHSYSGKRIGIYRTKINEGVQSLESEPDYTKLSMDVPEIEITSKNLTLSRNGGGASLIDSENKVIAHIDYCIGYDEASDKLIFKSGETYISLPIYSYQEILKAADDYLAECGG